MQNETNIAKQSLINWSINNSSIFIYRLSNVNLLITSKSSRGISVNIDNGRGSSRYFEIVSEIDDNCMIELDVVSKHVEINGKTLSPYQTKLLLEFLQQTK